jgi:hypothetical protein
LAHQFFIKLLHHSLFILNIPHGVANKSFQFSSARLDVIKVQDFAFASITYTHIDNQATISFLTGKLYGFHTSFTGKIEITHPQESTIESYNFLFHTG